MRNSWMALLALGLLLGCGGGKDAVTYFEEGAALAEKGEYDAAIEAYQAGLDKEPGSAVGINLLGMAYRWKYNQTADMIWKDMEIETFQKAVAADSTYLPAIINLGATYYYLDRKAEAAPLFRKALEIDPQNPERKQLEEFIKQGEPEAEPPADG